VCDVPAYARELTGLQGVSRVKLNTSLHDYFADCVTASFLVCDVSMSI